MNRISNGIFLGGIIGINCVYIVAEKQIPRPDYTPPPYSTRSVVEPITRQINVASAAISPTAFRLTSSAGIQVTISSNGRLVRIT